MGPPAFAKYKPINSTQLHKKLEKHERKLGGEIGIYGMNTNRHQIVSYHENERFPVQGTFKLIGVAALLNKKHDNL